VPSTDGDPIAAVVLGGSGYVAGELLRLLGAHPRFRLTAVLSDSRAGEPLSQAFAHLAVTYPEERFSTPEELERVVLREPRVAVFSAAPHGAAAKLIDGLLMKSEAAGGTAHVVDISADYRYRSAAAYEAVYRRPHGAPARIASFSCALPEHLRAAPTPHMAHPGCFATATLLAAVPLLALGLIEPELFVAAVTGSSGSGRQPLEATHHPSRHGDLYSYSALAHRHAPEMSACALAATGVAARFAFVPHSGPFARGIHVTLQGRLREHRDSAQVRTALREFYAQAPFVRVREDAPRIKDVVTSNYAHLSAVSDGRTVAVLCALDNLNKGAAGGAVQWMNRLWELPETTGLTAPAPGWT
jgi:N-acetyl-gamma-glutamyl-phosphate reductase common form